MPHTLRLLSQWTYTEIKPGNVEAFLPNSTAPSLNTPTIPPAPAHSHSQRRRLSFDVNADSLLECSDLRWRYRTSRPVTDAHTSAAPSQCLWKAQIEPFSQSLGRVLIVCEIQRRLCIICKTLCWYSKWALMAVEAQLGFITSFAVFDKQWKKLFLQENSTRGKKKRTKKKIWRNQSVGVGRAWLCSSCHVKVIRLQQLLGSLPRAMYERCD